MLLPVVTSLSYLIVLATGVAANPIVNREPQAPISLPITKNMSLTGRTNFAQRDRARLRNLANAAAGIHQFGASDPNTLDDPLDDMGDTYTIGIGVGDPASYYNLIVDTGSSNTWVGAFKPYRKTKTSVMTGDLVSVTYGLGYFKGIEYKDSVTIAPGVAISRQSIGVSDESSHIYPYDGILGLGRKELTRGDLYPHINRTIPTVTDNLFKQGKIEQNLVSASFEPTSSSPVAIGQLTFGGTDSTKYTGNINYVPVTDTFPSTLYWGVNASFQYGEADGNAPHILLGNTAGIVDTGTTLLYIATDAYNRYVDHTGAVIDEDTGLLRISKEKYDKLQSLFLDIGGNTYELIPNAQIWPRALNELIGGKEHFIYLVMQDIGQPIPGLEFIAGLVFLERYYSVYDTDNLRVGLAPTQYTKAEIN
ncbi:aspartic peptidase domain-containing protein [Russula emetica]|nr:aspartic peptidase domain-containing protein [Russula emetica]